MENIKVEAYETTYGKRIFADRFNSIKDARKCWNALRKSWYEMAKHNNTVGIKSNFSFYADIIVDGKTTDRVSYHDEKIFIENMIDFKIH